MQRICHRSRFAGEFIARGHDNGGIAIRPLVNAFEDGLIEGRLRRRQDVPRHARMQIGKNFGLRIWLLPDQLPDVADIVEE
jgi:hypothetical protein